MKTPRGFTLIELLVVTSIIALLSSVVMSSLSASREKARYASVVQGLRQAEIAFNLLRNDRPCWPREGSTDCGGVAGGNPTLATLIGTGSFGLSNYLSAAPPWPFTAAVWQYDNDGDSLPVPCTSYTSAGVRIFVASVDISYYRELNRMIDGDADSDTVLARACGKIQFPNASGTGDMSYVISPQQ